MPFILVWELVIVKLNYSISFQSSPTSKCLETTSLPSYIDNYLNYQIHIGVIINKIPVPTDTISAENLEITFPRAY